MIVTDFVFNPFTGKFDIVTAESISITKIDGANAFTVYVNEDYVDCGGAIAYE